MIKIKNSTFRHNTGAKKRNNKLKKWTNEVEEIARTNLSPTSINQHELYMRHRLQYFVQKQNIYFQRKVARLKFKKFICVEKTCHKLSKHLVNNKKTLIAVGSSKTAANSPIKKYIRLPQKKLLNALRSHADVIEVDEFRTTKLCCHCYAVNIVSQSPHRYTFCPECRIVRNRDVNAGANILYKGICALHESAAHENFDRRRRIL